MRELELHSVEPVRELHSRLLDAVRYLERSLVAETLHAGLDVGARGRGREASRCVFDAVDVLDAGHPVCDSMPSCADSAARGRLKQTMPFVRLDGNQLERKFYYMGRPAVFDRQSFSRAALRLAAERGPRGVTIAALAAATGAPTGSIYHRYRSRDELLADLWMEVVEGFQREFVAELADAPGVDAAVQCASFMARWARAHPVEARLLLLHRRQDFVAGGWPAGLARRASALEPQIGTALRDFALRAGCGSGGETMARLRYALLDAPLGALKPCVQSGRPVPPVVDALAVETARAVLAPLRKPGPEGNRR